MLERFHMPEKDAVRVCEDALKTTVQGVFEGLGVPPEDAQVASEVLVAADIRGVDTHGSANLLKGYVKHYREGNINPRPKVQVVRETPATANIDSDVGLGIIVAPRAMEIAISKARDVGVGIVTVHNGHHLGMASYHAMMALEHDMIGVCMTSCAPHVVPTFAAAPRIGTNPIALAAPAKKEPPFVYDAATSAIAGNKVAIARRLGVKLMPGWLAAEDGSPIMEELEPTTLDFSHLLPLGGTREMGSHKGYGLACIVDILSGILSGGGYGMLPGPHRNHHMLAAYRIDAFTDAEEFKGMMDEFLGVLKETPPTPGCERVLYPGQIEWETEQERRAKGIPIHREVIQWFREICVEMEIPYILE